MSASGVLHEVAAAKCANLVEIARRTSDKHLRVADLITLIATKEEHGRAQFASTIAELKGECLHIRKLLLQEQDLGKQFEMARDGELARVGEQSIDALRMLGVITSKQVSEQYAHLRPEIAQFQEEVGRAVELLQGERKRMFDEISQVFWLLYHLAQRNQEQATLFGKEDYQEFVGAGCAFLGASIVSEGEQLAQLVRMFEPLIGGCAQADRELLGIYLSWERHRHMFAALETLAQQHFLMPVMPRDAETMAANASREMPLIRRAQELGIGMLRHDESEGVRIRGALGAEWAILRGDGTFKVHWDTIPVVRKDMMLLVRYVTREWGRLFLKRFPVTSFVNPTLVGASRTREVQEQLQRVSKFATSAELSMHVRGLAIDWGTLTIANEILDKIKKGETRWHSEGDVQVPSREELMDRLNTLLEEIVAPLAARKVNGHPLVVPIRESHGCFHMSINPDPDALQELARMVS